MTETNHVQTVSDGNVYCHKLRTITGLTPKHLHEQCRVCPYFRGDAQGAGIECYYDDASGEAIEQLFTSDQVVELENRMKNYIQRFKSAIATNVKEDDRAKYVVSQNEQEIGTIYFGMDLAAEITTQDAQLELEFLEGIVNPIEVPDPEGGIIFSSVGDIQFEDAMVSLLRGKGYEVVAAI